MIFTWDYQNLCIIFKWWRLTSPTSLILSLTAIILLCAGYEGVREISRRYEAWHSATMNAFGATASSTSYPVSLLPEAIAETAQGDQESSSLLGLGSNKGAAERQGNITRAGLYAIQVFYSFFIMLLFMTYVSGPLRKLLSAADKQEWLDHVGRGRGSVCGVLVIREQSLFN